MRARERHPHILNGGCQAYVRRGVTQTVQTTFRPDVNELLDDLLSRIRYVLRANLVGVYLYGSLVTGDFDRESSDIDLLAATSSDASELEIDALRHMHHALAVERPEWDDRLDVSYLSVTALQTFRSQLSQLVIVSPGEPFHVKEVGKDWLMNWYMVREKGVALFGPSPKAIIPSITAEEFVQAVREYAAAWGEYVRYKRERKDQAYAILTMCRALYVHRTGNQVSKKCAALWAQEELPQWSELIEKALMWREAWRDTKVDHAATYPETVRFVNSVRNLIVA
jgi:predicted nucleotidyltransferase